MNFIEELKWRGMLHDIMPGTEDQLKKEMTVGYIGFDPTADSLHIGSLVQIMLLQHFQLAGHKPIVLIGGATGRIGDPSGKTEERKLLSEDELNQNVQSIQLQLQKFLNFQSGENRAELVNNYDWFKNMNTLNFLREVGKYLTVNYLLSKGFIKDRIQNEISFTEFNYILMQAYDFMYLLENKNCKLQMGGSDQWGNITAGAELIRKKLRKDVFAFTCPLLTKSDGGKFGKTEEGNVWLSSKLTSPYKFYQFWLNVSDDDAKKYIRVFTLLSKDEIENLEKEHNQAPHLRILQKALAKEVTIRVHSEKDFQTALNASEILFGNATKESLLALSEKELLEIFEGVPQSKISKSVLENNLNIVDFLSEQTKIFPSKAEVKRNIDGISVNKQKVSGIETVISKSDLLNNKYILIQRGKKNYFLVIAE